MGLPGLPGCWCPVGARLFSVDSNESLLAYSQNLSTRTWGQEHRAHYAHIKAVVVEVVVNVFSSLAPHLKNMKFTSKMTKVEKNDSLSVCLSVCRC